MSILSKIKLCLWIVIIGLVVSGLTAFPLESELGMLNSHISASNPLYHWFNTIYLAIKQTNRQYPYLSYGTDWLAFAHLVIAIVFIGPLRDPVKNIWVIEFGMISCILIFPLAFIAGPVRHIPIYWCLIDCSFGVVGFIPLCYCRIYIKKLGMMSSDQ